MHTSSAKFILPIARRFLKLLPLPTTAISPILHGKKHEFEVTNTLRVFQFNMLADGLSGLTSDLGAFSRVTFDDLNWEVRKDQLLYEITQYNPDVITLQECDHFYDWFLPELNAKGFDGVYAPKPASACLQVSDKSDGCAIFVKRNKLRITSVETLTYALAVAELGLESKRPKSNDDTEVRPQNQVALVAVCHFMRQRADGSGDMGAQGSVNSEDSSRAIAVNSATEDEEDPTQPPVVIATTHLKAAKNGDGEKFRQKEIMLLLDAIERSRKSLKVTKENPAVILTGDLNACPKPTPDGYMPLAYEAVKNHSMNFRSVYNDDTVVPGQGGVLEVVPASDIDTQEIAPPKLLDASANPVLKPKVEPWTSWKVRTKKGKEKESKLCIDYIMYTPLIPFLVSSAIDSSGSGGSGESGGGDNSVSLSEVPLNERNACVGIRATSVLDLLTDEEVGPKLLPSASYPSDHISIVADLEIGRYIPES
jgi:exonuclease III